MTMKTITYDQKKHKLVPIEPTEEMMSSINDYSIGDSGGCCPAPLISKSEVREIYGMLLFNAPEHPESNREVVCWAPLFIGDDKPLIDLVEVTKEDLIERLKDCEGMYQCIPLIAKPD